MAEKALGRGLSALISESSIDAENKDNGIIGDSMLSAFIPLDQLIPGVFQPREIFNEEKLLELTESIKENGVIQPIIVRPTEEKGQYQIIAGERRWRASKLAGLHDIPVVIKRISDQQALEVALIENIQRQSLTPIEEAEGYNRLREEFDYTQEELAESLGKSRSHITNMLRVLQLPEEIKSLINQDKLSMGHARALIKSENPIEVANEIVAKGLSVRQAEKFAAGYGKTKEKRKSSKNNIVGISAANDYQPVEKDEDIIALENSLSENLGLKVSIDDLEQGGRVSVYFDNLSELDKILQKLG